MGGGPFQCSPWPQNLLTGFCYYACSRSSPLGWPHGFYNFNLLVIVKLTWDWCRHLVTVAVAVICIACLTGNGCGAVAFLGDFGNISARGTQHGTYYNYSLCCNYALQFLLRPPWNMYVLLRGPGVTGVGAWPGLTWSVLDALHLLPDAMVPANSST
jgi:hypothetical protein